jgi:hypothetical protein
MLRAQQRQQMLQTQQNTENSLFDSLFGLISSRLWSGLIGNKH